MPNLREMPKMKTEAQTTAFSSETPLPKKRVRRVGTLTMGIALIVTGLLIVATLLFPYLDLTLLFNLCPLLLVILGVEVIVAAMKGEENLKYDFLSMIVCFLVICSSLAAAFIPQYIRYYGPQRDATEYRLQCQLDDLCAENLSSDDRVASCRSNVYLETLDYDPGVKLEQLGHAAYIDLSVSLVGPYDNTEQFAADVYSICQSLQGLNVRYNGFYFSWESDAGPYHSMNIFVDGMLSENRSPVKLAAQVDEYWGEEYIFDSAYESDSYSSGDAAALAEG